MSSVGTWTWAQQTGGRLRRRDRAELIRQGIAARLERILPRRRGAFGHLDPMALPDPPDSALARDAEDRVRELSIPALRGHCMRTWAFAALFARRDRVEHDPELLYLACVLHDLGLTEAHDGRDGTSACFGVEGARAAHAFVSAGGAPQERARAVAQAISLHLNIDVPERLGAEAALLSRGVALDVVGRRRGRLPRQTIAEVCGRWERDGFGEFLLSATKRQAEIRPQSRAALLHRLGFAGLIANNPLDEARNDNEENR